MRRLRRIKMKAVLLVLGGMVALLLGAFSLPRFLLEGPIGPFLPLVGLNDTTQFASGYTDLRFLRVQRGMGCGDVERLLGPPLATWTLDTGEVGWAYSRKVGDTSYHVRTVFLRDCKVTRRRSEYHVD